MKKYIVPIVAFIFAVTFLVGCGEKPNNTSSIQQNQDVSVDAMAKVLDNLFDKEPSVIVEMLGEPDIKSEPTAEDNDIWSHQIWTYSDEHIVIEMADRGSGYVVCRATAENGCKWGTSKEVFVGGSEKQAREAYADLINEDYSSAELRRIVIGQPSNCIIFNIENEIISSIMVGEMG